MDIEITGEGKFNNVADKLSTKSYYYFSTVGCLTSKKMDFDADQNDYPDPEILTECCDAII